MRILPVVFVLAFAFAAPALAKLPVKTVKIVTKTKGMEIEIAYPQTGNAAIDAEVLAWAKSESARFKTFGVADPDGSMGANTLDIGFDVARNDDRIFAVLFTESEFTGGAHPNSFFQTMNFLTPDGWRVYLPEIFTREGLKTISKLAIADLDKQLAGPDSMSDKDWIARGAGEDWSNFKDFTMLPDTLDIQFAPYNVAAYAAGPQETKIPLAALKNFYRKDWRAPLASFDCAKAATNMEKTICSDAALARLDRAVAGAYASALGNADSDAAKKPVREVQRGWLARRNATCAAKTGADGIACLKPLYKGRLKELNAQSL